MRPALWAPVAVMLAWTLCHKLPDWLDSCPTGWRAFLMTNAFVWMFLAWGGRDVGVLLALATLNCALFVAAALRNVQRPLAVQLGIASALVALALVPLYFGIVPLAVEFARIGWSGALALYVILASFFSRRAMMGALCAMAAAVLAALILRTPAIEGPWMLQFALMAFLLHSLRWDDVEHAFRTWLRWILVVAWVGQSLVWAWNGAPTVALVMTGGATVLVWLVVLAVRGACPPPAIPVAGALVMVSGPGADVVALVQSAPAGALAVAGSFLLLALGTVAALTKHRWHRREPPSGASF
jgi:hypothetical protein